MTSEHEADGDPTGWAAVAACGPVSISTGQLMNPRAFKHVTFPLRDHADAFAAATGRDNAHMIADRVWQQLVFTELLPVISVPVTTSASSYNPAYARYVNGLTCNDDALGWRDVNVTAHRIADEFIACAGRDHDPERVVAARQSALDAGMTALVGRTVTVHFAASPDVELYGRMLAVTDDSLVIGRNSDGGELAVVDRAGVSYVTTWQLTADEDATFGD